MEFVRASRLFTQQIKSYLTDVLPLFKETTQALFNVIILCAKLAAVLFRPLLSLFINLYLVLSPTLITLLQKIWQVFCLQPARILAVEAGIVFVLFILTLLENRFRFIYRTRLFIRHTTLKCKYRYRQFIKEVGIKSKLAALAIPHVIYLFIALAVHLSLGSYLAPFTTGLGMVLVACVRPAISTLFLLYSVDIDEDLPDENTPIYANIASSNRLSENSANQEYENNSESTTLLNNKDRTDSSTPTRRSSRLRKKADKESMTNTNEMRKRAARVAREIENDGNSNTITNRLQSEDVEFKTPLSEFKKNYKFDDGNFQTPNSTIRKRRRDLWAEQFESMSRDKYEIRILRFWVVFALLWTARSLTWYFCPNMLIEVVRKLDTLLFYVFIWAQIGMTAGADILYAIITRILRRKINIGQRFGQEHQQKLNILGRLLVAMNILSLERASNLTNTIAESGLPLVGLLFLITPRVATYIGTLLIGLLLPSYLSICELELSDGEGFTRHNWLSYWSVYSLIDAGFAAASDVLGWLPLWYHAKMCFILWLQLPYYRGSVVVLDRLMGQVGNVLTSVRKEVVTPRKRKIA